jgi:hypothetical protein
MSQDDGKWDVIWAIARSGLALVLFFFLKYAGLVTAVYAVIWAFRAREKGHKLANVGIAISIVTLIFIGIGWFLRMNSTPVGVN